MHYNVIIIGGGPGGIFSAYELTKLAPSLRVAVFEAGHSLEKRHCPIDGKKVKSCIGCKSCMVACPYGAMTVTVMNQQAQALKCDLCHHRAEGPACVAACPTQALRVMVPAELEALCAQKRQRLALA